ncbi:hypothetical protein DVH24_008112, partial [Malus domestica]
QITSALPTPTDVVAEKAITTSTIPHKVALTSPRLADTAARSTTVVKRPHLSTKETGVVAQPSKRVKMVEEPVVHLMINPQPDVTVFGTEPSAVPIEASANSAASAHLLNPKTTIAQLILD